MSFNPAVLLSAFLLATPAAAATVDPGAHHGPPHLWSLDLDLGLGETPGEVVATATVERFLTLDGPQSYRLFAELSQPLHLRNVSEGEIGLGSPTGRFGFRTEFSPTPAPSWLLTGSAALEGELDDLSSSSRFVLEVGTGPRSRLYWLGFRASYRFDDREYSYEPQGTLFGLCLRRVIPYQASSGSPATATYDCDFDEMRISSVPAPMPAILLPTALAGLLLVRRVT